MRVDEKAKIVMGIYFWLPTQNNDTDDLSYRQLGEILGLEAVILIWNLNFQDINWKVHTTITSKTEKFLKHAEDNFRSAELIWWTLRQETLRFLES